MVNATRLKLCSKISPKGLSIHDESYLFKTRNENPYPCVYDGFMNATIDFSEYVIGHRIPHIMRIRVRGINFEFPEFHALETPDINPPDTSFYAGHKTAGITPSPLESNFVRGINFECPEFHALETPDINPADTHIYVGHKSAGITPAPLD
ncbi:hypothetical protein Fcan01_11573 [Folsomia candida]|uniref:Uncharacterized protein n=1 Tax=Folsomia candida TaxID=158441 RepID=A0A226EB16_FOLCA|nr:hypothetical protein Fcan01_11573 [Folsomia candida]